MSKVKKLGDFILTIDSDDEIEKEDSSEEEMDDSSNEMDKDDEGDFDEEFKFEDTSKSTEDTDDEDALFASMSDIVKEDLKEPEPIFRQPVKIEDDDDDIIIGGDSDSEEESNKDSDDEEEEKESDDEEQNEEEDNDEKNEEENEEEKKESDDESDSAEEEEEYDKTFFSENKQNVDTKIEFKDMSLSRPLLKAISKLEWTRPTPVQAAAIPVLLRGQDVCASAVTGSGKTAAFLLPILERLLYRDKSRPETKALILLPTRELATQCFNVAKKLAFYTDIRFGLIVGGLKLQTQEAALKTRPEVIIATPGRILDHLINTPGFDLESIEILVLDEADRLLEIGFEAELHQIIEYCPKQRQSMLFSATMTDKVDKLIKLSLKNPVRIQCDSKVDVAKTLKQEFIKIKEKKKGDKEAILLSLCTRTYKDSVIIFCNQKVTVRRLRMIFYLRGLEASELHSDLSQNARFISLERFMNGMTKYLICTDLAARGIDIKGVKTVINYDMPRDLKSYIHRVGRTARAGNVGTSVSFADERSRPLLKHIVKRARKRNESVKHRIIPPEVIKAFKAKIESLEPKIKELEKQLKVEAEMKMAEMELTKAENIAKYEKEILSRPKKEWFQSKKQKEEIKKRAREEEMEEEPVPKKQKISRKAYKLMKEKEQEEKHKQFVEKQQRLAKRIARKKQKEDLIEGNLETGDVKKSKKKKKKKKKK